MIRNESLLVKIHVIVIIQCVIIWLLVGVEETRWPGPMKNDDKLQCVIGNISWEAKTLFIINITTRKL